MKLLAIETATSSLGCCLWSDDGPAASCHLAAPARSRGGRHAEALMPTINEIFARTGWAKNDLEAVAVDCGPGLFTGLRVGLAAAGALSQAMGLPCAGVTSMDVLAHPHRRRQGPLAVLVDARRGEVYWCVYLGDGSRLQMAEPPAVAPPADVARRLAGLGGDVLAVGDGAWRYREVLSAAGAEMAGPGGLWPRAEVVAELGAAAVAAGGGVVGTPAPLYLRQADVRIGWDQVDGRVGPDGVIPAGRP